MSYATVETALLSIIQKTNEFNANNSSIADPRILTGGRKQACIIRYGGHRLDAQGSLNRWAFIWTVLVDLWFQGDGEFLSYNELIGTTVQNVLTQVLGYPLLNGTSGITKVDPGDASDPEIWQGSGARNWWRVSFPIYITEVQTVALNE